MSTSSSTLGSLRRGRRLGDRGRARKSRTQAADIRRGRARGAGRRDSRLQHVGHPDRPHHGARRTQGARARARTGGTRPISCRWSKSSAPRRHPTRRSTATMALLKTRRQGAGRGARRTSPDFVGNRLQHALWREAIALVAEGVCDAKTVDDVVKSSFGARLAVLGPLENADLVGTGTDPRRSIAMCCPRSIARRRPRPSSTTDRRKVVSALSPGGVSANGPPEEQATLAPARNANI